LLLLYFFHLNITYKCLCLLLSLLLFCYLSSVLGQGSAVSIAARYVLGVPEIKSQWGRGFLHLSGLTLEPIQPPAGWLLGLCFWGRVAEAWH
jgi:hypothetical protein